MKSNLPEEEKIGSVVNDLEKLFIKFWNSIKVLLANLKSAISELFKSWKKLMAWGVIGAIVGVATLLIVPRKYESSIILRTHIDANEQLSNDVDYLNSLISSGSHDRLATILGTSDEETKKISSIEMLSAANITERLSSLNKVYSGLDSALKQNIIIEDLLEDDKYTFTNKFRVSIYSTDPFVFEGIEDGLITFFERVPELNRLRKNKLQIIKQQKHLYENEIQNLDSLKKILNQVMLEKANHREGSEMTINMGESGESDLINPLSVYNQVSSYSEKITELEERIPLYEKCYFIVSHLNDTGQKSGFGGLFRAFIGAVLFGFLGIIRVLSK
ncbi:YveK family protein [Salibacter halophilus]|uniref:Uncharacterized protein n=1 Tax=Salibacter halophilus TaxID=1803916 RepID=A0A6N6M879_9FLAO|nr:hypothetical protein [Salibacter halophilus]KAB1064858.1 hypothetical protein F3059_05745 [Salibacter halophilus]